MSVAHLQNQPHALFQPPCIKGNVCLITVHHIPSMLYQTINVLNEGPVPNQGRLQFTWYCILFFPTLHSLSLCLSLSPHSRKQCRIPPVLRSQLASNLDVEGIALEANLTVAISAIFCLCDAGGLAESAGGRSSHAERSPQSQQMDYRWVECSIEAQRT